MKTFEQIKEEILELSEEQQFYLYNEYAMKNNYESIYNQYTIDDIFQGMTPFDILNSTASDFKIHNRYYYFNGYGNLTSCEWLEDAAAFDVDALARYILDNGSEYIDIEED